MDRVLARARSHASEIVRGAARDWSTWARRAMDRVVRKSLEMRVVALRTPALRPRS